MSYVTLASSLAMVGKPYRNHQTHFSFPGGGLKAVIHVPDARRKELYALLAEVIRNSQNAAVGANSLVERIPADGLFKLFLDIDGVYNDSSTIEKVVGLNKRLVDVVESLCKKYFGVDPDLRISVGCLHKMHVVVGNINVTKKTAVAFVDKLRAELTSADIDIPQEALDASVYNGQGLRMIGCHKGSATKVADVTAYEKVFGLGAFQHKYAPVTRDTFERQEITLDDIIAHSIIPDEGAVETKPVLKITTKVPKPASTPRVAQSGPASVMPFGESLVSFIKVFHPHIVVTDVSKSVDKKGSILVFVNTSSTECPAHQRTHKRSTISFTLSCRGITQSCWHSDSTKHLVAAFDAVPKPVQQLILNDEAGKEVDVGGSSGSLGMTVNGTPLDTFRGLLSTPLGKGDELKKMDLTPSNERMTTMGHWTCSFPKNRYCPVCKVTHDAPQNFAFISPHGQRGIGCNLRHGDFYPDPPAVIPPGTINMLFTNNTIINHYGSNEDRLNLAELFPIVEPVFGDEELNRTIFASLTGFETAISEVFCYMAAGRFRVTPGATQKDFIWYAWSDLKGIWFTGQKAWTDVVDFLRYIVTAKYLDLQDYFADRSADAKLNADRKIRLNHIVKRLQGGEKEGILREAALTVCREDPDFFNKLDSNKDLLAFHGTVFDFGKMELRKTESTDYITLTTGYQLPDTVDPEVRQAMMQFIVSIMPDEDAVNYLLKWLASTLDGHNREEIFTICTGVGRNGKGVLRDLMNFTLGDLSHGIQASMLTSERPSSSSPTVDIAHLKGKRFVSASEPEKNASINAGFLKFMSGNDPITGRLCHKNDEFCFEPQHSIMLLCNKIPALDAEDDALFARSRVIDFPYKFTEHPVGPKEKVIDRKLKQRMKGWGPQFMLLLLERYREYHAEGLIPTAAVIAHTEAVRAENDIYLQWIDKNVVADPHAALNRPDVWRRYDGKGKKSSLYAACVERFGVPKQLASLNNGTGWTGWRLL